MQSNFFETIFISLTGILSVELLHYLPDFNLKNVGQIIILTLTCAKLYYPEIKKFINKKRKK